MKKVNVSERKRRRRKNRQRVSRSLNLTFYCNSRDFSLFFLSPPRLFFSAQFADSFAIHGSGLELGQDTINRISIQTASQNNERAKAFRNFHFHTAANLRVSHWSFSFAEIKTHKTTQEIFTQPIADVAFCLATKFSVTSHEIHNSCQSIGSLSKV